MSTSSKSNRPMKRQPTAKEQKLIRTCSIWRALEVIGDTPTLLIYEAIWFGERRFDRICRRSGQLKALTSNRLKALEANGLVTTRLYSERPPRKEYVLTEKGRELYWTSLMLLRWEQTWSAKKTKLQVKLTHTKCGKRFNPVPMCGHCGEEFTARDVDWEEGPGVGLMAAVYKRRRRHRDQTQDPDSLSLFTDSAEIMGDRWSGLIIRSVFTGLRRFDEILGDTGMATNILTERLNWLVEKGMLTAVLYQTNPARHEYWLTRKGLDYYPVLVMLQRWGDTYYASPEGPPLILEHKSCGHDLNAYVGCSECGEAVLPTEVTGELVERRK